MSADASSSSSSPPSLKLTDAEAAIAAVLRNTCEWITSARPSPITLPGDPPVHVVSEDTYAQIQRVGGGTVEARIAGGWVRDKLLQRDSDDLDVSLSSITGFTFAHFLAAYLASPEYAASDLPARIAAAGLADHKATSSIAKIAANPEQSKNLETATAKVFGLSLDFVNLRKEEYDGNTRIPVMSFGTAKEDAERRDITINSLFYNVHTEQVEDLTGMGLDDLRQGLIRTPLAAFQTFLDDPLRVLRCIRFAARFGYILHPDIVRSISLAAQSSDIFYHPDRRVFGHLEGWDADEDGEGDDADVERARIELSYALGSLVSRERFGIEVDKMIRGPDPVRAITLIIALDLFEKVFHPPASAILPAFLPFELDPDSPAFTPTRAAVEGAAKAADLAAAAAAAREKMDAMTAARQSRVPPGANTVRNPPSVYAYHAACRLQAVWDAARAHSGSAPAGSQDQVQQSHADVYEDIAMDTGAGSAASDAAPKEYGLRYDMADLGQALEDPALCSTGWVKLLPQPLRDVVLDPEQRARLFMAAALLPLEKVGVLEAVGGGGGGSGKAKKTKLVWAGEAVLTNGLKLGNKQGKDPMTALFRARQLLDTVCSQKEAFFSASADAQSAAHLKLPTGVWPEVEIADDDDDNGQGRRRAKLGLLLRQPSLTSSANHLSLAPALLFAILARLARRTVDERSAHTAGVENDIVREYVWLWDELSAAGLLERAEEKPVLDGNRIKTALGFQPGPMTPRIQTAIVAWQYARKTEAERDPDACAAWLKQTWDAGGIVRPENRAPTAAAGGGAKKKDKVRSAAVAQPGGEGASRKRQKSEEKV